MAKDFLIRTGTGIDDVEYQSLDYLPISGGTVTGELNVPAPTKDSNAATKKYVDDYATSHSGFVKKTGDSMTGNLLMGDNLIKQLKYPVDSTDAAHKGYVDGAVTQLQGLIDSANKVASSALQNAATAQTAAEGAQSAADEAKTTADAAKTTADANTNSITNITEVVNGLKWINTYKTLIEKLAAVASAG